jgi:hypothetical protein
MKFYKYISSIAASIVFISLTWIPNGFCYGDDEKARDTLRDIGTIGIVVGWDGTGIDEEALKASREKVQRDMTQKLKQKGIKVHSKGSIDKPPFLYIEIHSYRCGENVHAAYFGVKVMQEIYLKKKKGVSSISPTWSSGGVVGIIENDLFEDMISSLVDEFASAYLSVNSKDKAKRKPSDQKKSI